MQAYVQTSLDYELVRVMYWASDPELLRVTRAGLEGWDLYDTSTCVQSGNMKGIHRLREVVKNTQ
jgi:hypothetical protein